MPARLPRQRPLLQRPVPLLPWLRGRGVRADKSLRGELQLARDLPVRAPSAGPDPPVIVPWHSWPTVRVWPPTANVAPLLPPSHLSRSRRTPGEGAPTHTAPY